MKKVKFLVSALIAIFITGLTSCSSSDEETPTEPATELSVSVYDLTLDSHKNSSASFSIKSNADWSISNQPDWITLSSTKGNGNATVTIKATNENNSAQNKTGSFTIATSDKSIEITITQIAGLIADCNVRATEVTVMSQSVAFNLKFGNNVSYFYSLIIPASEMGAFTDKALVEYVEKNSNRLTPNKNEDNILYKTNLYFDSEYYIVSFGYDKDENRGEIEKRLIRTKKFYETNSRPSASIGNTISWDSYNGCWLVDVTSISSQTKNYYIYSEIGSLYNMPEYNGGGTPQAIIALKMKRLIDSGELKPHIREGNDIPVKANIVGVQEFVFVAIWAVGENGEFATDLDYNTYSMN